MDRPEACAGRKIYVLAVGVSQDGMIRTKALYGNCLAMENRLKEGWGVVVDLGRKNYGKAVGIVR